MKNVVPILIFLLFTIVSCSKEADEEIYRETATVKFTTYLTDLNSKKTSSLQSLAAIPSCSQAIPVQLEVVISRAGVLQEPWVIPVQWKENEHSTSNELVLKDTEELVIDPGVYYLENFKVLDSKGNNLWLAPVLDDWSGLSGYVENPLPLKLILESGSKRDVMVEVFCSMYWKPPYRS